MAKNSFLLTDSSIGEIVRQAESDYVSGHTQMSKYEYFDPAEDINRIYAYLDSKNISGETDSQGREKPIFNVSTSARNIWFRATDIDRRNMRIRSTKSQDDLDAYLATVHLQDWIRREKFGMFLNAWGLNSAGFNESVLKFVEQENRLIPLVIPWGKIYCDFLNFDDNPKIEPLELTPGQLKKRKGYDKELVKKLCEAQEARETPEGQKKDTKDNYIKVYEVHGVFPLSYITCDEKDQDDYVQQMHVISYVAKKDESGKKCYDDYTLYCGREEQDPYMIGALMPEPDGSIRLRGAVKNIFDVQWMMNHTAKSIKDQLDIASLTFFQTADPTFLGQNAIEDMVVGDILIHEVNKPLTQVANQPTGIPATQSFGQMYKQLGYEINGISESMMGQTAPSGTAWRQIDALLQENHSLFEVMTENKALVLEEATRRFIIPFIKRRMDTVREISATLADQDIQKIDARYIKNSAIRNSNKVIREKILNGEEVTPEQQMALRGMFEGIARDNLNSQGRQRFFTPSEIPSKAWKETLKDFEWDAEVDITDENIDREAMNVLSNLLGIIADPAKAAQLQTPMGRLVFNKILQYTKVVSPVELSSVMETPAPTAQPMRPAQPTPPISNPQLAPSGGGSATAQ